MNQKGFVGINILVITGLVIFAGIAGYFIGNRWMLLTYNPNPAPVVCTQEAKQCADGSYVGRTGPNCEFAKCPEQGIIPSPITKSECKKDSDCPSSKYSCEATQGIGTVCPTNDPLCVSTSTIVSGICKLKEGNRCAANSDCVAGLLCHNNICTSPIGRQCSGSSDNRCPADYECVQGCGSPVGYLGEPSPPYFCQLKGFYRPCPICLASNTNIATPDGQVNVKDIKRGMKVWSENKNGEKIISKVVLVSRTLLPATHKVVHLVLTDGREVWASPNHPTINGSTVAELKIGESYDGANVQSSESMPYWDNATYDILPDSDTGHYWANGILLKSTIVPVK